MAQFLLYFFVTSTLFPVNSIKINAECSPNIDFKTWQKNSPKRDKYKLIKTQIYIRHGDRIMGSDKMCWNKTLYNDLNNQIINCPVTLFSDEFTFDFKKTNNKNFFPGNCMLGELTKKGQNQQIINGINVAKRYIDYYKLLPQKYLSSLFSLRATYSADLRTQKSASSFFSGIYNDINKVTVSIKTRDTKYETMAPNPSVCPQYQKNMIAASLSPEFMDNFDANINPIFELLNGTMAEYLGTNSTKTIINELIPFPYNIILNQVTGLKDLYYLFDCSNVYSCHNSDIPDIITQDIYNQINKQWIWSYSYLNLFPDFIDSTKNVAGPLLKEMNNRLNDVNINNDILFYLDSGHDTGPIIPLLLAFGVELDEWVPYADLISVELFQNQNNNKLYILVSFNGIILTLPCSNEMNYNLCPLKQFRDYILPLIPNNEECPGINPHDVNDYIYQNDQNIIINDKPKTNSDYYEFSKQTVIIIATLIGLILIFNILMISGIFNANIHKVKTLDSDSTTETL